MKTIEENNKLIAEFMGFEDESRFVGGRHIMRKKTVWKYGCQQYKEYPYIELKYHCSWDWIIPVVEQIYDTELYEQEINQIGDITHALIDLDINGLHNAVVEFIEFYNKQN